jgi:hypothetical protein
MNKKMQRKSEWTRFRLDPPAIVVGPDGAERVIDVVWIETLKDRFGRGLAAIGSPYVLRINFDQVRETLSNPTPGALTGHDAEAILLLKVQVVFTTRVPSGVIFRPLRHGTAPRHRQRATDKAVAIPLAGTPNKGAEALWIGILGLLVLAAIGNAKA